MEKQKQDKNNVGEILEHIIIWKRSGLLFETVMTV